VENLKQSFAEESGTGLAVYFKIGLHFVIIFYSTRLKAFYHSKWFVLVYFFFFLGLLTTYIFPEGAISLSRPFRYFYIFQPIMYAYFVYYLFRTRQKSGHFFLLIGLIMIFVGIFTLSQYSA